MVLGLFNQVSLDIQIVVKRQYPFFIISICIHQLTFFVAHNNLLQKKEIIKWFSFLCFDLLIKNPIILTLKDFKRMERLLHIRTIAQCK